MRPMILWESFLTFATQVGAGLAGFGVIPVKALVVWVVVAQGLNAATIVYKTGTWNPNPGAVPAPPTIVVQGQHTPPPE